MAEKDFFKGFIEYTVKQLVSNPDAVEVTEAEDDLGTLVTLQVAPEDMGKIIGKAGQTAKSLRVLLRVVGSKYDKRVNLKILEPTGGEMPGGMGEDQVEM